jgi:phospholipase/lecithinase/hemolysin
LTFVRRISRVLAKKTQKEEWLLFTTIPGEYMPNMILQLIIAALFILSPQISPAKQFKEIITFGDSLSDVGNVAGLTVPGFSPKINGYYLETHFSDNILWIETLAQFLNLPARTPGRGNSTTLQPLPQGNTWAWGGSEAASGSVEPSGVIEPIPNLLTEVNQFLTVHQPDSKTLYAIWSGADNLLIGGKFGPQAARNAVSAVEKSMRRLEHAGARQLLIFNMPKLGDTPSAQSGGRIDQLAADIYSDSYNRALRKTLRKLRKDECFKARIYFIDVYTEIVKVVNTVNEGRIYVPSFFIPGPPVAISNVTDEGLDYFNNFGTYPTNYLFWDDVHPTTQGHQVIAGLVLKAFR